MKNKIHYMLTSPRDNFEDSSQLDLGIAGFIRTGSLEEAKQHLAFKQKDTRDKLKVYQLVEIEE